MDHHLTVTEVAYLAGIKPATITAYTARGQMPAPVACPCCGYRPVWKRQVIERWLKRRSG